MCFITPAWIVEELDWLLLRVMISWHLPFYLPLPVRPWVLFWNLPQSWTLLDFSHWLIQQFSPISKLKMKQRYNKTKTFSYTEIKQNILLETVTLLYL